MADEKAKGLEPEKSVVDPATEAAPTSTEGEAEVPSSKWGAFVKSLSKREKIVGTVALFLLLFFILDLIMIRPVTRHLKVLEDQIHAKEVTIPKKLAILKHQDRILKQSENNTKYLTSTSLSQEEEIAVLLQEVERVSQRVGLFVSNIFPVDVKSLGPAGSELRVDIEGAGGMMNIKRFIQALEESNPPIRVSAMNIRSQGANTDDIRYRFTILKLGLKEIV